MSGKLDQSLDEINAAQRRTSGRRRNPGRRSAAKPAVPTAPAGGISKNKKPLRATGAKGALPRAPAANSESKIIVSNLPKDVSEQQIKEYFVQSVGPIKRVDLVYGPNSQSRGIANVSFHKADGASKAFQKLNGLLVDSRPIKIEIVVGAAQADKVIPSVKTLAERTTQPKSQPKSAALNKKKAAAPKPANGGNKAGAKPKSGRNARPAKKSQDELDSEMADYFGAPGTAPAATDDNAAAPAAGEAMEEIM